MKKALVVTAHPDDGELGAGGLILKLKKQGLIVHYLVFVDHGFAQKEKIFAEFDKACRLLGVKERWYNFPIHKLPDHSHEVRDELIKVEEELRPNLVLIPSINDTHQDHLTVAWESIRTFRNKETVLSYELLRHGSGLFKPNVFVDVENVLDKKIEVLKCHTTEYWRNYYTEEVFRSTARVRGVQVGIKYAEAFEAVKIFWEM